MTLIKKNRNTKTVTFDEDGFDPKSRKIEAGFPTYVVSISLSDFNRLNKFLGDEEIIWCIKAAVVYGDNPYNIELNVIKPLDFVK